MKNIIAILALAAFAFAATPNVSADCSGCGGKEKSEQVCPAKDGKCPAAEGKCPAKDGKCPASGKQKKDEQKS